MHLHEAIRLKHCSKKNYFFLHPCKARRWLLVFWASNFRFLFLVGATPILLLHHLQPKPKLISIFTDWTHSAAKGPCPQAAPGLWYSFSLFIAKSHTLEYWLRRFLNVILRCNNGTRESTKNNGGISSDNSQQFIFIVIGLFSGIRKETYTSFKRPSRLVLELTRLFKEKPFNQFIRG